MSSNVARVDGHWGTCALPAKIDRHSRVCHGFRLTKQDFWVDFDHFWSKHHFWGSWGSGGNWLEPKTKPLLNILTKSVLRIWKKTSVLPWAMQQDSVAWLPRELHLFEIVNIFPRSVPEHGSGLVQDPVRRNWWIRHPWWDNFGEEKSALN